MESIVSFFRTLVEEQGIDFLIGQGLGILAIILGFISYQMRSQRSILLTQGLVSFVFCIHYLLIGAYSGMAMNAVSVVRTFAYDYRARTGFGRQWIPPAFTALQVIMCAFTWEAWYSIFVLLGIGINTYCMSFSKPQNIRKSILITSPLVLIYDVFARSIGGCAYESVAVISSAIGIVRHRKGEEGC